MSNPIFHRPAIAADFAKKLLHPGSLDETMRDGLFITGIRRIGKTTFIRQDLIPELENQNALVIYVDLWENRNISPTETVMSTVRRTLHDLSTSETSLKNIQIKLPLMSFTFEVQKVGQKRRCDTC